MTCDLSVGFCCANAPRGPGTNEVELVCTLPLNHEGRHEAHDTRRLLCAWDASATRPGHAGQHEGGLLEERIQWTDEDMADSAMSRAVMDDLEGMGR